MAQRAPKQSQLDYLWVNFGNYSVSSNGESGTIPTYDLIADLLESIKNDALHELKVVGSKLIGYNLLNEEIFKVDISQLTSSGNSIIAFGKRYVEEGDSQIQFEVGTLIYYIKLSDGTELATAIEGEVYTGSETNTIVVNVSDSKIYANLKINNGDSVVTLNETSKGIQADLKLNEEDSLIKLTKSSKGLKAETDNFYTKTEIDNKLSNKGMDWNDLI